MVRLIASPRKSTTTETPWVVPRQSEAAEVQVFHTAKFGKMSLQIWDVHERVVIYFRLLNLATEGEMNMRLCSCEP